MKKPLVMVAPNGARLNKRDHPALPIEINEIVMTAKACFEAGADALHLHVRDKSGAHSLDPVLYREAIAELSIHVPNMAVQISTEAVGMFSVEDQLTCIKRVEPKWVSISVREISRSPDLAEAVYATCDELNVEIQHILYDAEDIALLKEWQQNGTIKANQNSVLLVLGHYLGSNISNPDEVQPLSALLSKRHQWMLCAFGASEHDCLKLAASLGGDCRIGFENSRTNANNIPWQNNAASVSALNKSLTE